MVVASAPTIVMASAPTVVMTVAAHMAVAVPMAARKDDGAIGIADQHVCRCAGHRRGG